MKNNEPNLIIKPKSTQIHHNCPAPSTQINRPNSSNLKEINKPQRKKKKSITQRSSNPPPLDLLQIRTIKFFMFFPNYYNQTQIPKPPPPPPPTHTIKPRSHHHPANLIIHMDHSLIEQPYHHPLPLYKPTNLLSQPPIKNKNNQSNPKKTKELERERERKRERDAKKRKRRQAFGK